MNRKYRAARTDIEETIKKGLTVSEDFLYAKVSRSSAPKAGFAAVVSKKTEKTSSGRHLLKRRIHAAIESLLSAMDPDFNKTVVFFAKKANNPIPYVQIRKEVEKILKKSGFIGK